MINFINRELAEMVNYAIPLRAVIIGMVAGYGLSKIHLPKLHRHYHPNRKLR